MVSTPIFSSRSFVAGPTPHISSTAQPCVFPKISAGDEGLRTRLARLPARHAAAHAESPGFVGSGKHDSAADGNGLAAQRRVKQLLYRGIKGVQVRMQDGGHGCHPDRYPLRFEVALE